MSNFKYKVEKRKPIVINGKEYPDFRVVLYVRGEWVNEWDGKWSENKANSIADSLNKLNAPYEPVA